VSFDFVSGDPDNLTGGGGANMADIQGPFYDLQSYLNDNIVVSGQVGSTGSILKGSGFTASQTATGVYSITLSGVTLLGVAANLVSATAGITTLNTLGTNSFEVRTFNAAGAAANFPFSFVAFGAEP